MYQIFFFIHNWSTFAVYYSVNEGSTTDTTLISCKKGNTFLPQSNLIFHFPLISCAALMIGLYSNDLETADVQSHSLSYQVLHGPSVKLHRVPWCKGHGSVQLLWITTGWYFRYAHYTLNYTISHSHAKQQIILLDFPVKKNLPKHLVSLYLSAVFRRFSFELKISPCSCRLTNGWKLGIEKKQLLRLPSCQKIVFSDFHEQICQNTQFHYIC